MKKQIEYEKLPTLKIQKRFLDLILSGEKKFEFRDENKHGTWKILVVDEAYTKEHVINLKYKWLGQSLTNLDEDYHISNKKNKLIKVDFDSAKYVNDNFCYTTKKCYVHDINWIKTKEEYYGNKK